MAAANATAFFPEMTQLTGNTGGAVQSLPAVTKVGGRERVFSTTLTLAAQASGTTFGVARLPMGAMLSGINVITDTSLGSATISFGDANNTTLYSAAATLTATNTPTSIGNAATRGQLITSGYDCVSGAANKSYEDITLTTAVAALPGSGSLVVQVTYTID